MNKIINTIGIAACLVWGLTSCNDWLDVSPSTEVDRDELFSNEAGFADALAGIYTTMASDSLYGKNLTWYGVELMGGGATAMYGTNVNYMDFRFHPNSDYYSQTLRESFCDNIWNVGYNAIANVNSILDEIDKHADVFTGDDYSIFKGEALGLRAFLHFDLLRLFGPAGTVSPDEECIPYVSTLSHSVSPLLTVRACADSIIKDLEQAKELLKVDPMYTGGDFSSYVCSAVTGNSTYRLRYNIYDWHNRRFHFNYYAAVATMARVYLWMGDKTHALACAKEIIDAQESKFPWVANELVSNVASTSQYVARDRTFSTEQIFALNITDMEDRIDGYMIEKTKSFQGSDGHIEGFYSGLFDDATRAQDPRYAYLHATFSYHGNEFLLSNKYYEDNDYNDSYSPWSAHRLPLIRVSEMYYIAAECESDLTQATAYLEAVRSHRGMSAYPLDVSSEDDLQDEIEKEYGKEFIAEGQLFYYHKRLNQNITNHTAYNTYSITPSLYVMPRPDEEDTYGGR
jgi:hypothetical protein